RDEIAGVLDRLEPIELYWAFPGKAALASLRALLREGDFADLKRMSASIVRALASQAYRHRLTSELLRANPEDIEAEAAGDERRNDAIGYRPYFEVLIVDTLSARDERQLREGLRAMRGAEDAFLYDTVAVPSFEDAIIAVLFNFHVQAVLVRYSFELKSRNRLELLQRYLNGIDDEDLQVAEDEEIGLKLGRVLGELRPELDLYLVADAAVEDVAGSATEAFRRVFYRQDAYHDLHLSLLRGIGQRYETPFFAALR